MTVLACACGGGGREGRIAVAQLHVSALENPGYLQSHKRSWGREQASCLRAPQPSILKTGKAQCELAKKRQQNENG